MEIKKHHIYYNAISQSACNLPFIKLEIHIHSTFVIIHFNVAGKNEMQATSSNDSELHFL